jgi:hypothetical protein
VISRKINHLSQILTDTRCAVTELFKLLFMLINHENVNHNSTT